MWIFLSVSYLEFDYNPMADSDKTEDTSSPQEAGGDSLPRVKSEKELKKEKAKQEKLAKFQAKQEKLAAQKQQTKKEGEVYLVR